MKEGGDTSVTCRFGPSVGRRWNMDGGRRGLFVRERDVFRGGRARDQRGEDLSFPDVPL